MKRCTACEVVKDPSEFYARKSGPRAGELRAQCKRCTIERTAAAHRANPQRVIEWQKNNPERVKAHRRKYKYGITQEEYDELIQECAICGATKNLVVDHNHVTGEVRGLLCNNHNVGLGMFNDDPKLLLRAVDYLFGLLEVRIRAKINEKVGFQVL